MRIPKILKPFLKPTAEERTPTDIELDSDIEYVSYILHHIWPTLKKIIKNKTKRFFFYKWKFILGRLIIISAFIGISYLAFVKVLHVQIARESEVKEVILYYPSDSSMNLRNFLLQIAYGESRYIKHKSREDSQFWGLYQIGKNERETAGFGDIPKNVWDNHPEIQDLCMIELLKHNKKYQQPYIDKYSGKIVDGILVTESGILALSQIGSGYARQWLDSGIIPEYDEFGNMPRKMLAMGGFILNLDKVRYSIQDAVTGPVTIH